MARKRKRTEKEKRQGWVQVNLRVRPEILEAIDEQVRGRGLNKAVYDRPPTRQSFILEALNAYMMDNAAVIEVGE